MVRECEMAGKDQSFGESFATRGEIRRRGRIALMAAMNLGKDETAIQDFSEVYPDTKLRSDERYVKKAESLMSVEERNQMTPAHMFEEMFTSGVTLGNWLGNVSLGENGVEEHFEVEAQDSLRYDDILNRIDAFTTLDFPEPIEDEDFGLSTDRIVLGFDVTTNPNRNKLLDKITRAYNGDQELPFGFSKLDYYHNDSGERGGLSMLPRYTIGLSSSNVEAIAETARIRERDGTVDFGLNTGKNLINRFKVLSEIRAQNELYQAMLPDDMDSEIVQQADMQLYVADQCLHRALTICAQELVKHKCLPPQVIAEVEAAQSKGRTAQTRNIVQEYLLRRSEEIFASEAKESESRGQRSQGDGDVFVQIIQLCDELKTGAYNGSLDHYRAIMAHNQSIPARLLEQNQVVA